MYHDIQAVCLLIVSAGPDPACFDKSFGLYMMRNPDSEASSSIFPTTHWTVVNVLKEASPQDKEALLTDFIRQYTPAFRVHLIHSRGLRNEADIDDVIQGFLADKLIFRNLFDHVSQDRGRLRDYLRRSLDNYVYEKNRTKSAAAWNQQSSLDDGAVAIAAETQASHSEEVCPFDVGWALSVLTETIKRTKQQYENSDRESIWRVFDACVLQPLLTSDSSASYTSLAHELGLSSKAVQNRRVSALRAFGKHLTAVIAEYVGNDPDRIAVESAELQEVMQSDAFYEAAEGVSY